MEERIFVDASCREREVVESAEFSRGRRRDRRSDDNRCRGRLQPDAERRAASERAVDLDGAAVVGDDAATHDEPESKAARLGRREVVEQALDAIGRNTAAGVRNPQLHAAASGGSAERELALTLHRLECVRREIGEHALEEISAREDGGSVGVVEYVNNANPVNRP